ncbi:MAG: HEPN domain-containing protein [Bacteroidales bacterium]
MRQFYILVKKHAMINVDKQIKYWINSSESDIETAELLLNNKKILHGLFFCHLAVEKAIKAHVVKNTLEVPPRTHNLLFLSEKAKIQWSEDQEIFLGILMKYQLEGRYPDYNPAVPSKANLDKYLS